MNNKRKKTNRARRTGIVILVLVVLLACVAFLAVALSNAIEGRHEGPGNSPGGLAASGGASQASSASQPEPEPEHLKLRFSAVGDNLVHNGIYLQAQARAGGTGYDFNYCFENVKYFFEQFDVNWMNQETLVNYELPAATYPQFSTPGQMGEATYAAGWKVYSLSNNHTYDMGAAGISATRRFWEGMPEDVVTAGLYTGDDAADIQTHTVNGITIAYLSYTDHTNGLPTPADAEATVVLSSQLDVIERQIKYARTIADCVVVGFHWEVENSHEVTDAQRNQASLAAGWGADMIIGTHPHVIQPAEWIPDPNNPDRQVFVAYSLGNFISAQAQANQLIGLCLTFDVDQVVQPDGTRDPVTISNVKFYPTVTHYDGGYSNIRDYMFRDYTEELAAVHGVRERYPSFSKAYIQEVLQTYINPELLVLD